MVEDEEAGCWENDDDSFSPARFTSSLGLSAALAAFNLASVASSSEIKVWPSASIAGPSILHEHSGEGTRGELKHKSCQEKDVACG